MNITQSISTISALKQKRAERIADNLYSINFIPLLQKILQVHQPNLRNQHEVNSTQRLSSHIPHSQPRISYTQHNHTQGTKLSTHPSEEPSPEHDTPCGQWPLTNTIKGDKIPNEKMNNHVNNPYNS